MKKVESDIKYKKNIVSFSWCLLLLAACEAPSSSDAVGSSDGSSSSPMASSVSSATSPVPSSVAEPKREIAVENETLFLIDNWDTRFALATHATTTVCNPFDGQTILPTMAPSSGGSGSSGSSLETLGIVGKLKYLSSDQVRYGKVSDYLQYGHAVGIHLFLDQINVPTRAFDRGFLTQAGEVIETVDHNTLYEYFSVELESQLQLSDQDIEGPYQLALLSDDGAILKIKDPSETTWTPWVDGDGVHATRFSCATTPLTLKKGDAKPVSVSYFQGPRYHISLMLLWRPWPAGVGAAQDTLCGKQGNTLFFDSTVSPSKPKQAFKDLEARGWKVVPAKNFKLPSQVIANPCTVEEPVHTQITAFAPALNNLKNVQFEFSASLTGSTFECQLDQEAWQTCQSPQIYSSIVDGAHTFSVVAISPKGKRDTVGASYSWVTDTLSPSVNTISTITDRTTVTIRWTTLEPSTTKVLWGKTTAVSNEIPDDGILNTQHEVTLTGLSPASVYYFHIAGSDQAGNSFLSQRYATQTKR